MLDLEKESFYYNGWYFEFYRSQTDTYSLLAIGSKCDKRIEREIRLCKPPANDSYYQLFINKWLEKEEKEKIETFKQWVLKGGLELL